MVAHFSSCVSSSKFTSNYKTFLQVYTFGLVLVCSFYVHNHSPHRSKLDPISPKCLGTNVIPQLLGKYTLLMGVTFFENQLFSSPKSQIQGECERIWVTKSSAYFVPHLLASHIISEVLAPSLNKLPNLVLVSSIYCF